MPFEFEWDLKKEALNVIKHSISFADALKVFADPQIIHLEDPCHSSEEDRFYAIGKIDSLGILTVRYTVRGQIIRIFGAAKWRKWSKYYEQNTRSK